MNNKIRRSIIKFMKLAGDIIKKCAETSLLSYAKDENNNGYDEDKKSIWMSNIEFLDDDDKVIYVEDIELPRIPSISTRIFFAFRGISIESKDNIDDLDMDIRNSFLTDVLTDDVNKDEVGKFHIGFKNRSRMCLKSILSKLYEIGSALPDIEHLRKYEIVLCGHSLGGTAAAVSFINLKTKKFKIKKGETEVEQESIMEIEGGKDVNLNLNLTEKEKQVIKYINDTFYCVTFGAPSFGNRANQLYCESKEISCAILNLVHVNDKVATYFYQNIAFIEKHFAIMPTFAIGNYKLLQDKDKTKKRVTKREFGFRQYEDIEKVLKSCNYEKKIEPHSSIENYLQYFTKNFSSSTEEKIIKHVNRRLSKHNVPYCVKTKIGEGTFGIVMSGYKLDDKNTPVAVKKLKRPYETDARNDDKLQDNFNREVNMLKKIKCENVVEILDHYSIVNQMYIMLEYCDYDLKDLVLTPQFDIREKNLRFILHDCLKGLKALHSNKAIHRDIKPSNILVKILNSNYTYKISDFGSISEQVHETKTMTTRGTVLYSSPEVYKAIINRQKRGIFNNKVDIFSMAATILYCSFQTRPWSEDFNSSSDDQIMQSLIDKKMGHYTDQFQDLLTQMLSHLPGSRPTAESILEQHFTFY